MIQEITLTKRVQTPTPPNEWLYQDQSEDFRYFTKRVLLGKNAEPWPECTDEEKEKWEEKIIDLYPEAPNEWVYRDHDDDLLPDGTPRRQFEPSVTIPLSDLDLWHECTDQQRRDWEEQHPDPDPEPSGESSEGDES